MNDDILNEVKESLLSCIIGVISTLDLLGLKEACIETQNGETCNYYMRSVEDHCKMSIYNNPYIQ
jgi:hypothetical protein